MPTILKSIAPSGTAFSLYPPSHGCTVYQLRYTDPRSHKQERISSKGVPQHRVALLAWGATQVEECCSNRTNGKLTVRHLIESVLQYKRNHQPGDYSRVLKIWVLRLRDKFGDWDSDDLTADVIEDYKTWLSGRKLSADASRLLRSWTPIDETVTTVTDDDGTEHKRKLRALKPGSVNRDLALISLAYNRAYENDKISRKPRVEKFTDKELKPFVRKGFLTQGEYDRVMALPLPLWLRGFIACAYLWGNRSGELKGLKVRQVDLLNRIVTLEPGETKNSDGRVGGMTEEVEGLLRACCWHKGPDDYVFTRDDRNREERQLEDFRLLWATVLRRAGITRKITPHDLRRAAVRNMLRRGIDLHTAMKIGGWKTTAMVQRYNIVVEDDMIAAAAKIEAGARAERALAAQAAAQFSQILVSTEKNGEDGQSEVVVN